MRIRRSSERDKAAGWRVSAAGVGVGGRESCGKSWVGVGVRKAVRAARKRTGRVGREGGRSCVEVFEVSICGWG